MALASVAKLDPKLAVGSVVYSVAWLVAGKVDSMVASWADHWV